MRGITDYHRELLAKNCRNNKSGLEDAPWDARIMQVSEPDAADDPRA
jgi:hypothetical protein